MSFEDHLSLADGESSEVLASISRLTASECGRYWAEASRKITSLAKHFYLIDGDCNAFKRLLGLNVQCKIRLLEKLANNEDDRFRCSGLYDTTLEAMAIGLWEQGAAICLSSNPYHVQSVEHITDYQYGRLLGHSCAPSFNIVNDIGEIIENSLSSDDSIFKRQSLLIQSVLEQRYEAANALFLALVAEKVGRNGNSKLSYFRQFFEQANGNPDAEEEAIYSLEEAESAIDIELLALAALSRRHGVPIELVDYDYCPLDLQLLSLSD